MKLAETIEYSLLKSSMVSTLNFFSVCVVFESVFWGERDLSVHMFPYVCIRRERVFVPWQQGYYRKGLSVY